MKLTPVFAGCGTTGPISPYGFHSVNSYNICLCWTTEFIQCINNKIMATFHSATRLSGQCDAVLSVLKHSSRPEWTELVTKPTAEFHTVYMCGFKPQLCVGVTMFSDVCWVMLSNHSAHCQWDLCLLMNILQMGERGILPKHELIFLISPNKRDKILTASRLSIWTVFHWMVLSRLCASGG